MILFLLWKGEKSKNCEERTLGSRLTSDLIHFLLLDSEKLWVMNWPDVRVKVDFLIISSTQMVWSGKWSIVSNPLDGLRTAGWRPMSYLLTTDYKTANPESSLSKTSLIKKPTDKLENKWLKDSTNLKLLDYQTIRRMI